MIWCKTKIHEKQNVVFNIANWYIRNINQSPCNVTDRNIAAKKTDITTKS